MGLRHFVRLGVRFRAAGAFLVLGYGLIGCAPAHQGAYGVCVDRADRENALYLEAVGAVLSAGKRVSVEEWNGCDSAGNGAELSVLASPGLRRDRLWEAFVEAGWSPASDACTPGCAEPRLVRQVERRLVGVVFESREGEAGGVRVNVSAADSCWDDRGYRCG